MPTSRLSTTRVASDPAGPSTFAPLRRPLLAVVALCLGALGLAFFGGLATRQFRHLYLVWNLVLALVPLGLSLGVHHLSLTGRDRWAVALAVPWLFFLPNAPYVLTDFIHLSDTPDRFAWAHLLALAWFSFAALAAGLLSLRIMHHLVERRWGTAWAWGFAANVCLLTGIGVTLGRFHRWNSWDALREPFAILVDVLRHVPLGADKPSVVTMFPWAFGVFFGLAYFFVWTLTPYFHSVDARAYSAAVSAGGSGRKNDSTKPTT